MRILTDSPTTWLSPCEACRNSCE